MQDNEPIDPTTFDQFIAEERFGPNGLARKLGVHISTVWRWIGRGVVVEGRRVTLPARKIGGRVFILKRDAAKFLVTISEPCAGAPSSQEDPDASGPDPDEQFCQEAGL